MLLPLFHLGVFAFNAFTLYYDQYILDLPVRNDNLQKLAKDVPFKGRFLFLTIWCLVIQTIYFLLAFLNDVVGSNARSPKSTPYIRTIKDTLFSLVFPLAIFVNVFFWSVYMYNPNLMIPENVRKFFPVWLNHAMHTTIVPFVFLEMSLSSITYPSKKAGLSLCIFFVASYLGILAATFLKSGSLVYPLMDVMPIEIKIAFLVGSTVFGLILYFVCEFFSSLFNPKVDSKSSKASKSSGKKKAKKA